MFFLQCLSSKQFAGLLLFAFIFMCRDLFTFFRLAKDRLVGIYFEEVILLYEGSLSKHFEDLHSLTFVKTR